MVYAAHMPPRSTKPQQDTFDDWDDLVEESHIDLPPYQLRIRKPDTDPAEYEFLTIPCPSGQAFVNITHAQYRNDAGGVLVNLTRTADAEHDDDPEVETLFSKLMTLMGNADFPVVDKLASRVLGYYLNVPKKAEPGESSAS